MPIVFEKSANSSMWLKLIHLIVAVLACAGLGAAGWFIDDWFARIVIGLFLMIGLAIVAATFREMVLYSRSDGKWRIEITNQFLSWQSPVQDLFQSFRLRLDTISSVQSVVVRSGANKPGSAKNEFFIHLQDGSTMQLPAQEVAVSIGDVFEAVEAQGVRYQRDSFTAKKFRPQKKSFKIVPMKSWAS